MRRLNGAATFGNLGVDAGGAPAPDRGDPSARLFCLLCETKRVKIITSAARFGFAQKPFVCSEVQRGKTASAAGTG